MKQVDLLVITLVRWDNWFILNFHTVMPLYFSSESASMFNLLKYFTHILFDHRAVKHEHSWEAHVDWSSANKAIIFLRKWKEMKTHFVRMYGFSLKDGPYQFEAWHPSFSSAPFFSFSASLHYSVTLPPPALARNEVSQKLHTEQWKIFSHHFPSCQWLYLSKQTTTETRKGSALAFCHWNVHFMGVRDCQWH